MGIIKRQSFDKLYEDEDKENIDLNDENDLDYSRSAMLTPEKQVRCSMCNKKLNENEIIFMPISGYSEEDCFFCKFCLPKKQLEIEKNRGSDKTIIIIMILLALSFFISPYLFPVVILIGGYYWHKNYSK